MTQIIILQLNLANQEVLIYQPYHIIFRIISQIETSRIRTFFFFYIILMVNKWLVNV